MQDPIAASNALEPASPTELISHTFRLNALLRGELAAVNSYGEAAKHISDDETLLVLSTNRVSHATRALMLSRMIREAGGQPVADAGVWGHLGSAVERAASLISERAVLGALVQGEQLGMQSYLSQVDEVSEEVASNEIWTNCLLEQRRTEQRLQKLLAGDDEENAA